MCYIFYYTNKYYVIKPFCVRSNITSSIFLFNSGITIRRYIIEEWEYKSYLIKNKINPDDYVKIFYNNGKINNMEDIINSNLLPFYTKYMFDWIL